MDNFIGCTIRSLPADRICDAADEACRINPRNRPVLTGIFSLLVEGLKKLGTDGGLQAANALLADAHNDPTAELFTPQRIAMMTGKYWGVGGVDLGVQFEQGTSSSLANKVLAYMNRWSVRGANVRFRLAAQGEVRVSFGPGGYWSYLGTDVRSIPHGEQTMNLEGFTANTSDREYERVVTHETGHTLGCPHEHMREELVRLLDVQKTIAYFGRTQGWSASEVRQQVLTPLNKATIIGTPADQTSIMCYQIPGECTLSGKPIIGGTTINDTDFAFMSTRYPGVSVPQPPAPPPSPPPSSTRIVSLVGANSTTTITVPPDVKILVDGRAADIDDPTDVLTE